MTYESTSPDALSPSQSSSNAGEQPGVVEEVEATAAELGRSAVRNAERARTRAAAGLESAAKSVHAGAERAASAGHNAGDALASSARYVREHDVRDMMEDVMDMVRSNPGVSLLGAAALGFLIGRGVTRD